MLDWLVHLGLYVSGVIAEIFVSRDALNFPIVQAVIAVLLWTSLVFALAVWSVRWARHINGKVKLRRKSAD